MTQRLLRVPFHKAVRAFVVAGAFWSVHAWAVAPQGGATCIVGVTVIDPATGIRSADRRVVVRGRRLGHGGRGRNDPAA